MEEEDICETNVDQLRKPWEIEDHWQLRREFILEHKDKFERERLLCLSQLCVNIETMGNVYDDDLMSAIENLASHLPTVKNFRQLRNNQVEASKSARSQRKRQKDEEETRFNHNRMGNFNNNQNASYHNSYQGSKKPRFDSPGYGNNQGNNRNQSYNQEQRSYGRQAGGSYQDAYAQPPYGTRRPNAYTQRERPAQTNFQQPQRSRNFQQQQQQQQQQHHHHQQQQQNPQQPRQNFKRQNAASFFQQQYQQHLDSSIPSYSTTSYSEG